ncbi:MAG TPA: DMT family transporter [Bryobacteraceae bacterium]
MSSVALVLWGLTGVTQKLSTNNISFQRSFVWFSVAFFIISIFLVALFPLKWHVGPAVLFLAALGGLLNGLGALTSFAALESGGKASVVIPLISLYPLVTVVCACVFLGERLTIRQVLGVVCALIAVALLSQEPKPESPSSEQTHL